MHLAQLSTLPLLLSTLVHVAGCQCQMCLGYSQHFGTFVGTANIGPLFPTDPSLGSSHSTPKDYQNPQNTQDTNCTAKRVRDPSTDLINEHTHCAPSSSMTDNSPLTAYTREIPDGTASTSPLDHPAKRTCLAKSNEHCTQMHELVTPNSLASRIGEKAVWEDTNDMVLLSSPTQKIT